MESIVNFVAESVSLEEMKVLQGVSLLTSVWATEWQHRDNLGDIDGLMWEDLSEDWQKYLSRGTRADKPNRCATVITVCFTKSSKNESSPCTLLKVSGGYIWHRMFKYNDRVPVQMWAGSCGKEMDKGFLRAPKCRTLSRKA